MSVAIDVESFGGGSGVSSEWWEKNNRDLCHIIYIERKFAKRRGRQNNM